MDFIPEKKMGFGLMRLPLTDSADEGSIDMPQVCRMVDLFMENGFTYFDTAWMYHEFKSENAAREALVDRYPRESYTLATKLHADFFNTLEERDETLHKQLEKTGVSYFDYYLLHGISSRTYPKYEKLDCFNWIMDKKEKGLVRHIGFSYHDDAALLDRILTEHPEMEFVQLQLNYLDWDSPWIQSRECYETATRHGVPVIVMEPVKGGTLAKVPREVKDLFKALDENLSVPSWAMRFCAGLPNVMMVLSGASDLEQMKDNISVMKDFRPLTEAEEKACFRAAEIINEKTAIPCTECCYCTEGCPVKIPIPRYFNLYNEEMREDLEEKGWTATATSYLLLTQREAKPEDCIGCGQCESICPQHLPIIEHLKTIADHYKG